MLIDATCASAYLLTFGVRWSADTVHGLAQLVLTTAALIVAGCAKDQRVIDQSNVCSA